MRQNWLRHLLTLGFLAGLAGCEPTKPPAAAPASTATTTGAAKTKLPAAPPKIEDGFVLRPTFHTADGDYDAGTAFVVALPVINRTVVVTALHLLGPAGGLDKQLSAKEAADFAKSVSLVDAFGAEVKVPDAGPCLFIPKAGAGDEPTEAGDVLAFWGSDDQVLVASQFSDKLAEAGDTVWLAAAVLGGAPPDQRFHAAKVIGLTPTKELIYEFENPNIELRATSGAPVVNELGHVVAINCSGGTHPETKAVLGIGNPSLKFYTWLYASAAAEDARRRKAEKPESP